MCEKLVEGDPKCLIHFTQLYQTSAKCIDCHESKIYIFFVSLRHIGSIKNSGKPY